MKIEWLNDTHTRARVTRGWRRKRWAIVTRKAGHLRENYYYEENSVGVGRWLNWRLLRAERRADRASPWKPVGSLPEARIVNAATK